MVIVTPRVCRYDRESHSNLAIASNHQIIKADSDTRIRDAIR